MRANIESKLLYTSKKFWGGFAVYQSWSDCDERSAGISMAGLSFSDPKHKLWNNHVDIQQPCDNRSERGRESNCWTTNCYKSKAVNQTCWRSSIVCCASSYSSNEAHVKNWRDCASQIPFCSSSNFELAAFSLLISRNFRRDSSALASLIK